MLILPRPHPSEGVKKHQHHQWHVNVFHYFDKCINLDNFCVDNHTLLERVSITMREMKLNLKNVELE